eukprot:835079_1
MAIVTTDPPHASYEGIGSAIEQFKHESKIPLCTFFFVTINLILLTLLTPYSQHINDLHQPTQVSYLIETNTRHQCLYLYGINDSLTIAATSPNHAYWMMVFPIFTYLFCLRCNQIETYISEALGTHDILICFNQNIIIFHQLNPVETTQYLPNSQDCDTN